jgi:hypothetical protein
LRSVKGLLNRLPFRGKIVNQSIKINFLQTANRRKAPYVYDGIVPPDPSPDDIQRIGNDIASQFDDVFDQIGSLNCMEGPEMIIELTDDATHFYVNGSRPLPFADHPAVKKLLDDYVEKKIICPVTEPSDWAAPLVVTRKSDGSLRICVDHTRLNRFVRRPTHPTRAPRDAVAEITGDAKFFSTFDAANGYYQIPLSPSSQQLTVFHDTMGQVQIFASSDGVVQLQ